MAEVLSPHINIHSPGAGARAESPAQAPMKSSNPPEARPQSTPAASFPAKLIGTLSSNYGNSIGHATGSEGRREVQGAIDPLSQRIFERTQPENTVLPKTHKAAEELEPETADSAGPNTVPRTSTEPTVKRVDSSASMAKEKKKGVSFLSRFISSKKKDSTTDIPDDESDAGDKRLEGTDADIFTQPIGFVPKFPAPPKYIKVRSRGKKEKDFNRVFLAQELRGRTGVEIAQAGGRSVKSGAAAIQSVEKPKNDKAVWAMEFSEDGRYLAAGGHGNIVRVWGVIMNEEDRQTLEKDENTAEKLSAPVFKEKPIREYEGHTGIVLDLSWSKNNFLLSSAMDKTVRLWHTTRNECLCCFKHSDYVTSIQFHPKDDRFFLAGSMDSKLRLWSIPDKNVAYWSQLTEIVTSVAFTPDGKIAIAGCLSGQCQFYETEGLKLQTQMHVRSAHGRNAKGSKVTGIQAIHYPPGDLNGEVKLLVTTNDSRVRVYNFRDKGLELKLKGNENTSSQIRASFSDDAKYVICGSEDKKVYIWSTGPPEKDKDKCPVEMFEAHSATVTTAIIAPAKTRQLLQFSGDPLYNLCNPPPVTLLSRSESQSSRPATKNGNNPDGSVPPTPMTTDFVPKTAKPEESPAYLARSAHMDGNIIVTADYIGRIKVFRQDCAYQKRVRAENMDTSSKRMLNRNSSIATRNSKSSQRNSTSYPASDRILSWRQSIERGNGSHEQVTLQTPVRNAFPRSNSPRKSIGGVPSKQQIRTLTTSSTTPSVSVSTVSNSPSAHKSSLESANPPAATIHSSAPIDDPLMLHGDQSLMYWNKATHAEQAANNIQRVRTRDIDGTSQGGSFDVGQRADGLLRPGGGSATRDLSAGAMSSGSIASALSSDFTSDGGQGHEEGEDQESAHEEVTQLEKNEDLALLYPTIPLKHNISNWLEHSQVINMALHADDSSVEDNTSSIGDSTWDIVDDASGTTSEDEGHRLSRQHTPSTDGLELETESVVSGDGNDTGDESQGMESVHDVAAAFTAPRISESHESRSTPSLVQQSEFEEDMEDTNQGLRPISSQQQRDSQPFKFQEPAFIPAHSSESFEVRHVLRTSKGSNDWALLDSPKSLDGSVTDVVGSVHMRMSNVRLHLKQPYKVMFAGPASIKELVMQKIGSALASSLESKSPGSIDGLARFTVVPISSFGDGSSPEVLLVNSLGIDMSVDECMSASFVKAEAWNDTITLKLNGNESVESSWNQSNNAFTISTTDYVLPDVAIICLTEEEQTSTKLTRLLARSFMIRHEVPVIMISSESEWNKPSRAMTLDLRTPHTCLEYRMLNGQDQPILKRLPIDLATFLDIDSAQLGRHLMCISADVDAPREDKNGNGGPEHVKSLIASILGDWSARLRTYTNLLVPQEARHQFATRPWLYLLTHLLLLTGFIIGGKYAFSSGSGWIPLRPPMPVDHEMEAMTTSLSDSTPSIVSYISTQTPTPALGPVGSESPVTKSMAPVTANKELFSLLFEDTHGPAISPTNKSDKFTLHMIGDCHVVLRQPAWFTSGRRSPALYFNVTRNGEPLKYEFSTLFDGVHALKLAREDAYGILNISVWTKKKPMIDETFQVDFGTPWLKLAGWKRSAQALTEQVREELQSAQSGLNAAYGQTSTGVQAFMRDAVKKAEGALKEVERIGMTSLNRTSKTTEMMIAQSKELSRALSLHFHKHSIKTPRLARQKALSEVYNYTRRMSTLFTHQAQLMTEAATGLNVVALGHEFQQLREKHLRKSQKKALKMWWKVRGLPERKLAKAIRHERRRTRHQRSKVGGHR